jgi:hypothetical protein
MHLKDQNVVTDEPIYSYHAFLYPFKWSLPEHEDALFEIKTDLKKVEKFFLTSGKSWERRGDWSKPTSVLQWNEVMYFYPFVRPVLYDSGKTDSILLHYYYKFLNAENTAQYLIKLPDGGREYALNIDDVVISFYDSGVGVLAFHSYNQKKDQSSPQDILNINNYGRRIAPPFLGSQLELLGTQAFFEDKDWGKAIKSTKNTSKELAAFLEITDGKKTIAFDDFTNWETNQLPDQLPKLFCDLLPSEILACLTLSPVLDDRMFTVCWYGNKVMSENIKGTDAAESYKQNDLWYQYVLVDRNGPTVQNSQLKGKLLDEATNARWANYGTYYGMSRYSFVILTGEASAYFMNKVIASHTMTMYYKLALLTLVQRACVVRFSEEVTSISSISKTDKLIAKRVSSLYKHYIRFINKIYFREVTAQEQGIELYDKLQEQMWLDDQVKDLDREIGELHQYVLILDEEKRNDRLDLLTYIGAFFVVPGFIVGYFGINGFEMWSDNHWAHVSVMSIAAASLVFATVRSAGTWRFIWIVCTAVLMSCILFLYPLYHH